MNQSNNSLVETTKIALFKGKQIRKTIYNNEWWFVIVDVIEALTDSAQPDGYLKDMHRRDSELSQGWGQIATPLSILTTGGDIAGGAMKKLEERLGRSIVSKKNFLPHRQAGLQKTEDKKR